MSFVAFVLLLATGCASPGPPRAPSLQLPALVDKLQATRRAGVVELEFSVPERTTDGIAYRGKNVRATVCRAVETGTCLPVAGLTGITLPVAAGVAGAGANGAAPQAKLKDVLPGGLASGPARLLTYRLELSNEKGKTAGFGDAAFAAAGAAPADVTGLRAEGSRRGVAIRWQAAEGMGDVVLRRELVGEVPETAGKSRTAAVGEAGATGGGRRARDGRAGRAKPTKEAQGEAKTKPGVVWLSTVPEADPLATGPASAGSKPNAANGVLDDGAALGGTYRYAAERRETVQLRGPMGGQSLVLRGELSPPVEVTLQAVYPPPAPTDLVGTAFPLADGAGTAVDLIWTPADDPGTVGYRVWRETDGVRTVLTKELAKTPAFHDVLPAGLAGELKYGVVAVDAKGMESPAATAAVKTDGGAT